MHLAEIDTLRREVMHVPEESLESGTQAEAKRGRGRPRQSVLTAEMVGDLLDKGLSQTRIAAEYNVSKQTVSNLARGIPNRARTPREAVEQNFPWPGMDSRFKKASTYQRISEYLKWVELGSEKLTQRQRDRLGTWLDTLKTKDMVVVFDPTTPPSIHNQFGGWSTVPRTESDGDLIIRINEHTVLANEEEAREIWRMPVDRP